MNNNETSYLKKYVWNILGGVALAFISGGLYYKFFYKNEKSIFSEEQDDRIKKLKKELKRLNGIITIDMAIQIMSIANKVCDEMVKKDHPDIDERRRSVFNDKNEYFKLCREYLECKEEAYNNSTLLVLNKFHLTMEDLQKVLSGLQPIELEQKLYKCEEMEYDNSILKNDKKVIIKAFVYFGEKFIEEMKQFIKESKSIRDQDLLMMMLMVLKLKVDDHVYFNYKVNEIQLLYLLFKYDLYNEREVKDILNKISKFDEMVNVR